MRRFGSLLVLGLAAALALAPGAAADHGLKAFGKRFAAGQLGSFPPPAPAAAKNFVVYGHHDLGGGGFNADVYVHQGFAYVGVWGAGPAACPASGVKVVDIRLPVLPRLVGVLQNPALTTAEDIVVQRVQTASFAGDLAVTGIQTCDGESFRGFQLFDVTNPAEPRELGRWPSPGGGCHEIDMAVNASGRVLVACATPFAEVAAGDEEVHLVDVSNPAAPTKLAGWGLIDRLGADAWIGFGCFPASFAHSVRFTDAAATLYASYWDAGALRYDAGDPGELTLTGRAPALGNDEDGDYHSVAFGAGGDLLLVNPEDFSPVDEEAGFCEGDFDGWGDLQIFDNSDVAQPTLLAHFATENARSMRTDGFYSIHNTEVLGSDAFSSWYSDGVRWIDLTDPANPIERGFFVPPGTPDPHGFFPPVPLVWGVWPVHDLGLIRVLALSDINSGLWIVAAAGAR